MSEVNRYVIQGLNTDVPASQVPPELWTGATNMLSVNGYQRRSQAPQLIETTVATPVWIGPAVPGPGAGLVIAGLAAVETTAGLGSTIVTPAAGYTAQVGGVSGGILNNLSVLSSRTTAGGWYRGTAGLYLPLPGWIAGATARVMRCWRQRIWAGSVSTLGVDSVAWSSPATALGGIPTTWTAAPGNGAGNVFLNDTLGVIIDLVPLRDQLLIFKAAAFWSATFVGGASQFAVRRVSESFGMMNAGCAVDIGGQLVVLTQDYDVMLTDGQSFTSLASQQVQDLIREVLEPYVSLNCWMVYDERNRNVHIGLAGRDGSVNPVPARRVLVWNAVNKFWSVHDLAEPSGNGIANATYAELDYFDNIGPTLYGVAYASPAGQLVRLQGSNVWISGNPVEGLLQRHQLDLGAPDAVKTVVRIAVNLTVAPAALVEVRVGSQMDETLVISWGAWLPATAALSYQVPCFAVGRLISVEVRSSQTGFECHGFTVITGAGSVY